MTTSTGYFMIILCILLAKISHCQQDSMNIKYGYDCPGSIKHSDSLRTPGDLLNLLFSQGYPYATLDSILQGEGQGIIYHLECGPHFDYVSVRWKGQQMEDLWPVGGMVEVYPWSEILDHRQEFLNKMSNKGYPYTRLFTLPKAIHGDTLILEYSLDTVRRIYVQEVELKGDFSMKMSLFQVMTGVTEGQLFSLDRIDHSKQVISQWRFAELKSLEYDFNPYGVNLIYEIEPSQPSRFDLLIGLVPSSRPNKKYEITGNAYLDIRNQLKWGERIYLKFDKYANSSQSIDLRFDFPYLPLIRTGIIAEGLIDRRDSTVLDVHGRLGIQYHWKPGLKYAIFLQRDQSRLISINTRRLSSTGTLPEQLDYNYSAAGLQLAYHHLDNISNPRRGSLMQTTLSVGLKKLVRNGQILAIELPSDQNSFHQQYDGLAQKTVKSEVDVSWDKYIPIGHYTTFRFRSLAGWSWSSASLYQNELRRLGGFQDFRGFPEKTFYADAFTVVTAEYRFLFGAESNVYAFTDFGFIHQPGDSEIWDYPYSVGIGLNLGTKAGIFGISYAVGGRNDTPLSLDQSRVNFGLMVNY